MCGRYYVDDETSREIEKIVRKLDQRLKIEHGQDIHPSESAVVLTKGCREVAARQMQWGFPGFQGKGLLINARAEAILDKKTFRESVLHRRCVIPARHFYEWCKNKEKYTFQSPKQDATLFMAGCYQIYNGQNRFVILTTQANASGKILVSESSESGIRLAIAKAAASFISSVICVARPCNAPLNIPGNAMTLLT